MKCPFVQYVIRGSFFLKLEEVNMLIKKETKTERLDIHVVIVATISY
jgi:hypothetical protein